VSGDRRAHVVVGDEVGADAAGHIEPGRGDQERARRSQGVGAPAGGEHASAEDEVDVAAFPDAEADADVHLRPDGAVAHGLLGRPLRGREQSHGDGPAAAGNGVGVRGGVTGFLAQLGVLVDQHDERRSVRGGLPQPGAGLGQGRGAGLQEVDSVGEQPHRGGGGGGEPVEAGRPWLEFHPAF
jgi:hypothetical protein